MRWGLRVPLMEKEAVLRGAEGRAQQQQLPSLEPGWGQHTLLAILHPSPTSGRLLFPQPIRNPANHLLGCPVAQMCMVAPAALG